MRKIEVLTGAPPTPLFLKIRLTVTSKPGVGDCGTQPGLASVIFLGCTTLRLGPLTASMSQTLVPKKATVMSLALTCASMRIPSSRTLAEPRR